MIIAKSLALSSLFNRVIRSLVLLSVLLCLSSCGCMAGVLANSEPSMATLPQPAESPARLPQKPPNPLNHEARDAMENTLQITLSNQVDTAELASLHRQGLVGESPVRSLCQTVGGQQLQPVYELSAAEIQQDPYGFAREFKLPLAADADVEQAISMLQASPWIDQVRRVGRQQLF